MPAGVPRHGRPILVIDNGTHYLEQLQRALRLLRVPFRVQPGGTFPGPELLDAATGIILTGGEVHVFEADQLEQVAVSCRLISEAPRPILGLCLGCQLVAHVFGGTIRPLPVPVDRPVDIEWLASDALNDGLPRVCPMVMAHNDTVTRPGPGLVTLARSNFGAHEAIRHRTRPIFGVQFHPEVSGDFGRRVLANFWAICDAEQEIRPQAV